MVGVGSLYSGSELLTLEPVLLCSVAVYPLVVEGVAVYPLLVAVVDFVVLE
mgnify:CR=1 FL=1